MIIATHLHGSLLWKPCHGNGSLVVEAMSWGGWGVGGPSPSAERSSGYIGTVAGCAARWIIYK